MAQMADIPQNFLISKELKALVVRQLAGQLGNSIYGENNLAPFQLLWREAMPKPEKSVYVLSKIVLFL